MKCLGFVLLAIVAVTCIEAHGQRGKGGDSFAATYSKHKNSCACQELSCLCCFNIPTLDFKTCISFNQDAKQRNIRVGVNLEGVSVFNSPIGIEPRTYLCQKLPGKLLGIKFCLHQEAQTQKDGVLRVCTTLRFDAGSGAHFALHIRCLRLRPDNLSFATKNRLSNPKTFHTKSTSNFKQVIANLKKKDQSRRRK